jgi:hypothetical protein
MPGLKFFGFVIILFHPFSAVFFPVFTTFDISSTVPRTLSKGSLNLAAFSALLLLIALDNALVFLGFERSSKYRESGCSRSSAYSVLT